MPVPQHSVVLPSVQLAAKADLGGVTELRVHGVGGTPPDATLGDLAPEQVSGDAIAGFYRSSDHRAGDQDRALRPDVDRHVEAYSWGGLTSRSKVRVLWLALLPFLFANLAGWMCSARTRDSAWRFRLHRLAAGLGGLALTLNAALIAVMISADVNAYQAPRAGVAQNHWWLAPLGWYYVKDHPARQVMFGVVVVLLFVLALTWLASRTWKYEKVRPPYNVQAPPRPTARTVSAAALRAGLADDEFWDGQSSVRLITWLHLAVVGGFLAIVLGVTAGSLTGSPHAAAVGWIAIVLGAVTVALGAGYVALDALTTPQMNPPGMAPDEPAPAGSQLAGRLGGLIAWLLVPAGAALVAAGLFAWWQPEAKPGSADLPGMSGVIGWTALAIGVVLLIALVSMLLGLSGGRGTLHGAPWLTLMLGFFLLNILLLGAEVWVAHLVGPVTTDAARAVADGQIYLPYLIAWGMPLVAWAAVLAIAVFGLAELARWWLARTLPATAAGDYEKHAASFRDRLAGPRREWYWSGLPPFAPPGSTSEDPGNSKNWQRDIARAQFLGRAPHDATWLLWLIIGGQLIMAVCVWQLHVDPPLVIRNLGVFIAGLALPALAAFLYSAWNNPARRRLVGIVWDVGTFWPRSYHPLSPPCYTERAIPELQRRMWWLHDNGGRVILVTHSQGTVLGAAALVQPGCRPEGDYPALITFGSPLVKLYGWGFPAYFGPALLGPLVPGGAAGLNDWHNFYYPTDPIGGPVAGDLPAACQHRVDTEFPDPAECYYVYGQSPPASQGHSGYWADPRVWTVINDVASGLLSGPAAPCTEAAEGLTGQVRTLLRAAPPSAAALAPSAVPPDSAGQAVQVLAADGAVSGDGDDGQVGG
jgi:hypothetical protein